MSDVEKALRAGRESDDMAGALKAIQDLNLQSEEDATAVARFLREEHEWLDESPARMHPLIGLFQQVDSREAFEILGQEGLPWLRKAFDRTMETGGNEGASGDLLMFLTKIFALYADEGDLLRIAEAARNPSLDEHFLWPTVFESYHEEHPLRREILETLRSPLPRRLAGVAYLDFVNHLARESTIDHPFNTPEGHGRLEGYLSDSEPEHFSYAHSAAAALPFIDEPPRGQLLGLGLDHAAEHVQLEAAWASAKIGSRSGIEYLGRACLDPRTSAVAVSYLEELGELNAIPVRAKNPDFMAVAEMSRWLAHPMEYGRPPDEVTLFDTRSLHWPPMNEQKRLWLVKYCYRAGGPGGADDVGIGLVGSITFALFGEATADLSPEDLYGLYCCWELEVANDPRAPKSRSAAAGRELLGGAGNPGF